MIKSSNLNLNYSQNVTRPKAEQRLAIITIDRLLQGVARGTKTKKVYVDDGSDLLKSLSTKPFSLMSHHFSKKWPSLHCSLLAPY
jgi:hypothetical protein